jgi:5-(carboxyamino)imidazole ribonucleotide synthase
VVTQDRSQLNDHLSFLPAVHKVGMGGYDGRGVQVLRNASDIEKGFDAPGVLEKMVDIDKEISLIVAVDQSGNIAVYPPVDMVFDQDLNLLDYQLSPASLEDKVLWKLEAIALAVVKGLASPGIFAVETFVDKQGEVYVNETAPRVHNSGHHSIEANYSSQFDMLWRIMLHYPLGNTDHILPAAIVNLLGADGFSGPAKYEGLDDVLQMDNVFIHLYGKRETRPGRKMGHITIISADSKDLTYKAHKIKQLLKVIS